MKPARLQYRYERLVQPKQPFHFIGTVHKPSHFPAPVDRFKNGNLWFSMNRKGKVYGIKLSPANSKNGDILIRIYSRKKIDEQETAHITNEIRYRFGMDIDLTGFVDMASRDPVLAPVEKRWRGMRPSCAFSLYELLCITISLQNAQVSRSVKMLETLLCKYGTLLLFGGEELYGFWSPVTLAAREEKELRDLKVGYRAKSFLRVSQFFERHPEFENEVRVLPKDMARKRLQEIYGVGPATAWYLLFESLKHLDAFDHVSPWEQKILSRLMFKKELVSSEHILDEAQKRWGEWKMLAVHYLFEDLFWRRKREHIDWLEDLIRL